MSGSYMICDCLNSFRLPTADGDPTLQATGRLQVPALNHLSRSSFSGQSAPYLYLTL